MQPVLFELGPIPINAYGLMIGIGFLTGLYFGLRDARRAGIDDKIVADAAFFALPIAILGTRLLHIVMYPEGYSWTDPIGWIAIWRGGLVFQGAIPAAMLFLYIYFRHHGVDFWKFCDVIAPWVPLGHAFGRMGCFLNGCCYGKPSDVPWAIPFRRVPWDTSQAATGSPVFLDHVRRFTDVSIGDRWSHAVHPTQLYAVIGLLGMVAAIWFIRKKFHPYDGFLVPVYLGLYGALRFVIEFFRGDHNPTLGPFSYQQLISLLFIAVGVALYFILARRPGATVRSSNTAEPAAE